MSISQKRIKEIDTMPDSEIDTSDIPELGEDFWKKAKIEFPVKKKHIAIRLDEDVLAWFKKKGKGYQTQINTILRSYMNAHENSKKARRVKFEERGEQRSRDYESLMGQLAYVQAGRSFSREEMNER